MVEITEGKLCVSHNLLQQYEMCVSVGTTPLHTAAVWGMNGGFTCNNVQEWPELPIKSCDKIPLFISERPNTGWRLTLQTGTVRLQMKE